MSTTEIKAGIQIKLPEYIYGPGPQTVKGQIEEGIYQGLWETENRNGDVTGIWTENELRSSLDEENDRIALIITAVLDAQDEVGRVDTDQARASIQAILS